MNAELDYWYSPEEEDEYDFNVLGTAMGYGRVMNRLCDVADADWAVEETGGGCLAIRVQLEGLRVYVTDRDGTLSLYSTRRRARDAGFPVGWAIGIYSHVDDYCETRGWAESVDDNADVAQLLMLALADYRRHLGQTCDAGCWGKETAL